VAKDGTTLTISAASNTNQVAASMWPVLVFGG
jgi:hypothetical protein